MRLPLAGSENNRWHWSTGAKTSILFAETMPDVNLIKSLVGVDLRAVLTRINETISALLHHDHQIGHSYFMGLTDPEKLHFNWYHRIVPLLQEYFYNDSDRLHAVLGDDFLQTVQKRTLGS